MPRKVNYGFDHDEDYYDDDYDYYTYDDADAEACGGTERKQGTSKPWLWQCSFCTYDNNESLHFVMFAVLYAILRLTLELPTVAKQLEFHIHHTKEPGRVSRILSVLNSKTGKVTKKSPRCLTAKQHAVIEVVLHESVCGRVL